MLAQPKNTPEHPRARQNTLEHSSLFAGSIKAGHLHEGNCKPPPPSGPSGHHTCSVLSILAQLDGGVASSLDEASGDATPTQRCRTLTQSDAEVASAVVRGGDHDAEGTTRSTAHTPDRRVGASCAHAVGERGQTRNALDSPE